MEGKRFQNALSRAQKPNIALASAFVDQSDSLKPDVVTYTLFFSCYRACATTESSRPARTMLVVAVGEHSKYYLTTALQDTPMHGNLPEDGERL